MSKEVEGGRSLGEVIAASLGEKAVASNVGVERLSGLKSPPIAEMTAEAFERLQSGLSRSRRRSQF